MTIRVKALQNFDNVQMGQVVDLLPEYGKAVVESGLAVEVDAVDEKTASEPSNKKAPEAGNKAAQAPTARATRSAAAQQ